MNAIAWTGTVALVISVLGQLQLLEYHLLVQQKATERMLSRLRVNIDVNTGTVARVCVTGRSGRRASESLTLPDLQTRPSLSMLLRTNASMNEYDRCLQLPVPAHCVTKAQLL